MSGSATKALLRAFVKKYGHFPDRTTGWHLGTIAGNEWRYFKRVEKKKRSRSNTLPKRIKVRSLSR